MYEQTLWSEVKDVVNPKILSKNNLNQEIKNREKTFNNHLIANRIWNMPRIPKN